MRFGVYFDIFLYKYDYFYIEIMIGCTLARRVREHASLKNLCKMVQLVHISLYFDQIWALKNSKNYHFLHK